MNLFYFTTLLFSLQGIYWLVGRKFSGKVEKKDDYYLAGKSVSFFPLMMTFLATQVGGGLFLGAADEAYQFGWIVLLFPLGQALGLIAIGLGIGKRLASFRASTIAQVLGISYNSPALKRIASLLSICSLFMILVAQVIASSRFLSAVGLKNPWLFTVFWSIVILYTARGGLKAVISTDMVQALFFSITLLVCFFLACTSGEASTLFSAPASAPATSKLWGWLLMPMLFCVIGQDMGQRCFSASNGKTVAKSALFAGIALLGICSIPVFFGVLAKQSNLLVPEGSSALITAIENVTNPTITAVVGCAILAAILSTATSLMNAISGNIASDFGKQDLDRVGKYRLITSVLSFGALLVAFYFESVVGLLIQSYELSVSCLLIAVLFGIFKRNCSFLSGLLSILFGAGAFFAQKWLSPPIPREVVSIALSLVGYLIGEALRPRHSTEKEGGELIETACDERGKAQGQQPPHSP